MLTGRRLAFAEIVSHIYCSDLSRAAQVGNSAGVCNLVQWVGGSDC